MVGFSVVVTMKRAFFLLIICVATCSTVVCLEKATVLRVVDGDTLVLDYRNKAVHVRLIGVDTPETHPNHKAMLDARRLQIPLDKILASGNAACKFVKTIVKPGDSVQLEFDVRQKDKYRRLLAYVYLQDGTMLNYLLVKWGYASVLTIPPDVKYQSLFERAAAK